MTAIDLNALIQRKPQTGKAKKEKDNSFRHGTQESAVLAVLIQNIGKGPEGENLSVDEIVESGQLPRNREGAQIDAEALAPLLSRVFTKLRENGDEGEQLADAIKPRGYEPGQGRGRRSGPALNLADLLAMVQKNK